jgi:antitoxin component of MazEF toxin-antitoxin module
MRLHKVVNRVYGGTTYYRWVVSLPPKTVRELGWTDGQELEAVVRGGALWVQPSLRALVGRRARPPDALEEDLRRKTMARR